MEWLVGPCCLGCAPLESSEISIFKVFLVAPECLLKICFLRKVFWHVWNGFQWSFCDNAETGTHVGT